ncbi:hypothetical protein [Paenibacillus sp. CECT 9249]|uniref:YphA family membrane protein n=1 Tax=Paenibacillus sp. CECT 9249 TaxID=2845385 RepID=UPI001E520D2A|nr:hypothetical protein [Paenibacillus sp. CECT 9249]
MAAEVIGLNPGIISLLLLLIAAILTASGWNRLVAGNAFSEKAILLFMAGWLFLHFFTIRPGAGVSVNLGAALIAAAIPVMYMRMRSAYRRVYVSLVAILIAMLYGLFSHLHALDPVLIWVSPEWDPVIVIGLCIFMAVHTFEEQVATVSIGLLGGDLLLQALNGGLHAIQIGTPGWHDTWWLTLLAVRVPAWTAEKVLEGWRMARSALFRRKNK